MRSNYITYILETKNDKQSVQIDVTCRDIEKEHEQRIREAAEEFLEKVEKITGWK